MIVEVRPDGYRWTMFGYSNKYAGYAKLVRIYNVMRHCLANYFCIITGWVAVCDTILIEN